MSWNEAELEVYERALRSNSSPFTAFQKIKAINPRRTYHEVADKITEQPNRRMKALLELREGVWDIETTHLKANFGFMLSSYMKTIGKNEYFFSVITKKEIQNGEFDRRLISETLNALTNYDVIWVHYGSDWRFDGPFARSRVFIWGMEDRLPKKGQLYIKDTWPIAKSKLALNSNRLDAIADALGITNVKKTPLSPLLWQRAGIGDEEALAEVALHNKRDVQVLEQIVKRFKIFEPIPLRSF